MFIASRLSAHVFIASRLSAHVKNSTNFSALIQAFSIKYKNVIYKEHQNTRSGSEDSSISPLLVSGVVIAALYLKRNEIRKVLLGRERMLPVASCLEKEIETKQVDENSEITKIPGIFTSRRKAKLSQELKNALKRCDHKLLVFKEKHGWFS